MASKYCPKSNLQNTTYIRKVSYMNGSDILFYNTNGFNSFKRMLPSVNLPSEEESIIPKGPSLPKGTCHRGQGGGNNFPNPCPTTCQSDKFNTKSTNL